MTKKITTQQSQLIIYQTESGETKIDVRLEDETVWLTQKLMAELFDTSVPNINMHLKNCYKEGEISENSVIKDFLITAKDGKNYKTKFYNLDAIISVGYRIKSKTFINIEDIPDSPEEKEADLFAQKVLLPDFDKNEVNDYSSLEIAVDKMAKKYDISKSVIAGRLSYEFKDVERIYAIVNPFIEKMDYKNV